MKYIAHQVYLISVAINAYMNFPAEVRMARQANGGTRIAGDPGPAAVGSA
jgi:hypothetical protein